MISDQLNQDILIITDNMPKWLAIGTYLSHKSDLFTFTGDEQGCRITGPFMYIRVETKVGSMRAQSYPQIVVERPLSSDEIKNIEYAHARGQLNYLQFEEWWTCAKWNSAQPFEVKAPVCAPNDADKHLEVM